MKIPIFFDNFSVTNCVIYLFILEVCFCNTLDCSDDLTSQGQGHTIIFKVKLSLAFELST